MRCLFFITLLVFISTVHAVEIQNFKTGLLCNDNNANHWICHEVDTLYITGQGRCRDNGKPESCNWVGFSFDYEGLGNEQIKCELLSSRLEITDEQDSGIFYRDSYILDIPEGNGHFFNPQNFVFGTVNVENRTIFNKTICRVEGVKLFEYEIKNVYPKNP